MTLLFLFRIFPKDNRQALADISSCLSTGSHMLIRKRGWRQADSDRRAHNQPVISTRVGLIRRGIRHW